MTLNKQTRHAIKCFIFIAIKIVIARDVVAVTTCKAE